MMLSLHQEIAMKSQVRWLLCVGLILTVAAPARAQAKKFALLVGVNKYKHADLNKPEPLQYAEADVRELKAVLEKSGYKVVPLTGDQATLKAIREGIAELRKQGTGAAVVLAAFAGHGIQPELSKEAFFCPYDSDQAIFDRNGRKEADWDMQKTMLPLSEVIVNLKACGAESKAILVDACRNDPKTGRGRGFGTEFNAGDLPENLALMLSCSKGERAWEDKKWDHGAFFHHVLKGLRDGKGAIDGHVTANSLAAYVSRAVRTDVPVIIGGGATQKPHTIINGEVDFLIKLDVEPKVDPKVEVREPKPGEERDFDVGNGVKMRFCWVPGSNGKFKIGSSKAEQNYLTKKFFDDKRPEWLDDENEYEVAGVDGYWMGKYEVTQGQYVKLTGQKNPSWFCADSGGKEKVAGKNTDEFPVESVSWKDAHECVKAMMVPQGQKKVGLPSEVQWEWAARGGKGNGRAFYWGDVLNGDQANCDGSSPYGTTTKGPNLRRTTKVGRVESEAAHPWGLCDMAGNVWEWCEDYYGAYERLPGGKNPVQTIIQLQTIKQSGDRRVLRGGSFYDSPRSCRSALRFSGAPANRDFGYGFRVVCLR
jgi:formylglycine-generating enzyme